MQKTSITFLLDRSGSMQAIKSATIESYNAYIQSLKEGDAAEQTEFNLLQFDSSGLDKVHVNQPIKSTPEMQEKDFQPRASTPLIDATYKTIKAVEESVKGKDDKVVICIHTDGQENASTQYTNHDLNLLIKEKTALGWQFNFMGVGVDAYDQAGKWGIHQDATISTTLDAGQMKAAYRSMGSNAAMYASGQTAGATFSKFDKAAAGDYTVDQTVKKPMAQKSYTTNPQPKSQSGSKPSVIDDFKLN